MDKWHNPIWRHKLHLRVGRVLTGAMLLAALLMPRIWPMVAALASVLVIAVLMLVWTIWGWIENERMLKVMEREQNNLMQMWMQVLRNREE